MVLERPCWRCDGDCRLHRYAITTVCVCVCACKLIDRYDSVIFRILLQIWSIGPIEIG